MNKEIKYVSPFKKLCITVGNLPTAYIESMSYYEALTFLVNYLSNNVIPALNNNGQVVNELKEYVENYFENLDVQEEINNKLDEMAESGVLQDIITAYLQISGVLAYDTVTDMKAADNLIDGSKCCTLGFHTINDNGKAFYKVRNITNDDIVDEITIIALHDDNLIAELILDDTMNVKQFGAYGNGTTDDTTYIQKAIDKSKNIIFPEGTYLTTDNLTLKDNVTLVGQKATILQHNGTNKIILYINNCKNVTIDSLEIKNDSSQTGSGINYTNQYLMLINDSSEITIKNCKFKNAYKRGINIISSKNIYYTNNIFENATYDMLMLLQETENIYVDKCIFDNITSSITYSYLFATGVEDYDVTYEFASKNIHITNSIFKNNPNWEGIDTHCCNGFYCDNNIVLNCKLGIMTSLDERINTNELEKHGNIYIRNNYIDSQTTSNVSNGIVSGSTSNPTYITENVVIENNTVKNHGSNVNNQQASIRVENIRNLNINNNIVKYSKGTNLLTLCILGGQVNNNTFVECSYNIGVIFYYGTWFVTCKNNHIKNLTTSNLTNGIELRGIIQLENNEIQGATNLYSQNDGTLMHGVLTSAAMGKIGNYIKDKYNNIKYYCTDDNVRVYNNSVYSTFKVTGEANSYTLTSNNPALYYITEGQDIVISGAGEGGADLTTTVLKFDHQKLFTIKDEIKTSITNADVTAVKGNWTSL